MKFSKKYFIGCAASMVLVAASITAFAAPNCKTPAEVVAGITGRPVESVMEEKKEQNKSYGTIASEAGKLEEFKEEMLEVKKENLTAKVEAGTITQEQADATIQKLEENQAVCDGTGNAGICQSTCTNQGFCDVNQGNCGNQSNCDNQGNCSTGQNTCGTNVGSGQGAHGANRGAGQRQGRHHGHN